MEKPEGFGKALGELIGPQALAEYLGVPIGTVYGWRYKGAGPKGIKIGRHLRYRRRDVERWLDAQAEADPRPAA